MTTRSRSKGVLEECKDRKDDENIAKVRGRRATRTSSRRSYSPMERSSKTTMSKGPPNVKTIEVKNPEEGLVTRTVDLKEAKENLEEWIQPVKQEVKSLLEN